MGMAVNLDEKLVEEARAHSAAFSRSMPKQIEHWAKIGRIVEENPDLAYSAIKEILVAMADVKAGNVEEYDPDLL